MNRMLRSPALAAAALSAGLLAAPFAEAGAAPTKRMMLSTKVGRSNVQVSVILHPQVANCSAALTKEIRKQALERGAAHVRENLAKLVRQAGTDASGAAEFFGVSYLAGCPAGGSAWLAFPAEGKEKAVSRYAPELGWSPPVKL